MSLRDRLLDRAHRYADEAMLAEKSAEAAMEIGDHDLAAELYMGAHDLRSKAAAYHERLSILERIRRKG